MDKIEASVKIFISHASADIEIARSLKTELELIGATIWMAADQIQGGANFAKEITESISTSDAVLVLLSPDSIASPHVKREVNLTIDRQKTLIPVLIGENEGFVNTLPSDWKYWLTVIQILQLSDHTLTANHILKIVNEKNVFDSNIKTGESSQSNRLNLLTKKSRKLILGALTSVLIFTFAFNLLSNSNDSPNVTVNASDSAGNGVSSVDIPERLIVAKQSMLAVDYQNELPNFPTGVVDYEFQNSVTVDSYAGFRLFYPDDWRPLPELSDDIPANNCEQTFWVLRWRSANSDVVFSTADGFIDMGEQYVSKDNIKEGGAGYIQGFACDRPFFKFKKTLNGNKSNLADIYYELQFWQYKPGI